jgi:dihydrofolate reductase
MSKMILNLVMTFDGYVAGIHDEMDWLEKIHKRPTGSAKWDFSSFTSKVGAIIVGKRSYELGIAHGWFKNQAYGSSPIFVLCKNIPKNPSNDADFRFITAGTKEAYRQASVAAGDKWIYLFGGPNVFQQFLNENLVNEMWITIAPILIGKGIRLFDNLTERHIELEKISVTAHPNGMIETHYRIIDSISN